MRNKKKTLVLSLALASVATVGAIALSTINFNSLSAFYNKEVPIGGYSLTLNSSNKVSSAGDHVMKTAAGGSVTFTYTSVGSNSSGHTRINNGGSIVNKTQITSIETFKATFTGSGTLKARIAYVVGTWGEYFTLTSGSKVEFGSKPYFLELKAENAYIDLTSAVFTYSCESNPEAEPESIDGSYDITFLKNDDHDADGTKELTTTSGGTFWDEVTDGEEYLRSASLSKVYWGRQGIKFGSSSAAGYLDIDLESTYVKNKVSAITFDTSKYSNDTGKFNVYLNDSTTALSTQITPSEGGTITLSSATTLTSIKVETTAKRAYLSGISLIYSGESVIPTPENPTAYEVGFNATDANSNKYSTNSVFANDNALVVTASLSDGTSTIVPSSLYSYVITNSQGQNIDPTQKFPAVGVYTLTVNYDQYIPVEITLNVGEYKYMVDVTGAMAKVTFNTSDILADYLAKNLTATYTLSDESTVTNISYAEFASNDLGVKLYSRNVSHDMSKPFGMAGTYTLKVYCLSDEANIYYNISLTVNAIPVTDITLDAQSATMYPDDELQLTATITPTDATIDTVSWTSSNENVATVDSSGLVTAHAVGGATITATAMDGSAVYGTCVITVAAKQESVTDKLVREDTGVPDQSSGTISYQSWSGVSKNSDAVYAGQSAGGNNAIQLRYNNSNSGIVTTKSGGKLAKVVVEWNSATSNRTLNVYGKSSAYTDPTDLYNSSKQGTLIGSISSGSGSELVVSGEYTFVGVCSSYGGLWLDSISFVWGEGGSTPVSPVYPTSIELTGSNTVSVAGTTQLSVTYSAGTNVKNVSFSSNNTSIATVSNTGLVTGVAAGTARITASADKNASGEKVTAYLDITVSNVAVTSVTLNSVTASVKAGSTITLIATVSPSNATNKNVTWSSASTAIATVSNTGIVTGIAAGTTNITVTTVDGSKTAMCSVTVTAAGGGEEEFSITYSDLPSSYQTGSTVYTAASGIKFQAYNCAGGYSSKMQFKASGGYLQTTEALELQSITINDRESNTLTVYGSKTAGSFSIEIDGDNDVYDLTGYSYFKVARTASGAGYCSSITVLTGTPTPTDPTGIILSPTSAEVAIGGSKQLSVSYVPANANQNKEITWTSSNTNVATVNTSGLVSVKTTATAGQTTTITAKLTKFTTITATCVITVVEQKKDDHTVLIYMCGADLESKNQLATGDIKEILKVSGQPDDVNIVIETGGASSWASTYGISSTYLERYHVENKSLVRDSQLTYASMGLSSTLQSFIEYGLNNFPAERTGVVFWNHGGGMRGVCYDEKKNDDVLKNSEIRSAISGALANCGLQGQKLEWVGYDACLMAVQDIAVTNSEYFNYMIASEESEAGYGWDYDNWVDDLYAKSTTPTILKAIVDSFIADNGGASSSSGDQTLSYMNLSYAAAYKTAWENLAAQLNNKVTTSNKSTFNSAITSNVKHYADSDYDYFCTFDAWDFVDKLANNSAFSSFRVDSSYTTAVKNALANLVAYNLAQKGAGVSKGICMYWPNSTQYSDVSTYYTTSETTLTTWRSFCVNKGTHA